jgi:hypothetical protein
MPVGKPDLLGRRVLQKVVRAGAALHAGTENRVFHRREGSE